MSSGTEKPFKLSRRPDIKKSRQLSSGVSGKFGRRQGSESSQASFATVSETIVSTKEYSTSRSNGGSAPANPLDGEDDGAYATQAPVRLINTAGPSITSLDLNNSPLNTLYTLPETVATSPESMSPEPLFNRPTTPSKSSYDRNVTSPLPSSKSHWNQIRNAIAPSATTSTSRTNATAMPSGNNLPQAATTLLPRSQTPKPSRLARLGFRQVVDQTREVVQDETGKFEADIYQACDIARFGQIRSKAGSQSSYRPFMSSASLPLSMNASSTQLSKTIQTNESFGQASPSLKLLHQTLVRYAAGPSQSISRLPYESEVLSALSLPFLNNVAYDDEEQWLAIESFEIAITTWTASSKQREVDRVLWCCKAGLTPPSPVRSRIVGTLSTLLFSSTPVQFASPLALQNIMQGLHQLLHNFNQPSSAEVEIVHELCAHVSNGGCGQPEVKDIENEYGIQWSSGDTEASVRSQIIAEGIVRCMHSGSERLRRWMLNSIEVLWPVLPSQATPLCKRIINRRLVAFFRSSISLLRSDEASHQRSHLLESDANIILRILKRCALSDINQLLTERDSIHTHTLMVELLLQLLGAESSFRRQEVVELICSWYHGTDGQRTTLLSALSHIVEKVEWLHLIPMLQSVVDNIPEEERKELISIVLSSIHKRLVIDSISTPSTRVTTLFQSLAELFPQQFYKPLFSLATAVKDTTLVAHFSIVTAVARHLPDFWIHDSEMMAIAIVSDGKGSKDQTLDNNKTRAWAKLRVGQSLIALELIRRIRQLTKEKKDTFSPPDSSQAEAFRFATGLESRLAVLLEAKEKTVLLPLSQRILLSSLLLEIRLYTRSLKPALWLPTVITWVVQGYVGARLERDLSPFSDGSELSLQGLVTEDEFDEVLSTIGRIQSIYAASWQAPTSHSRQRSTMALSTIIDPIFSAGIVDQTEVYDEFIKDREQLMASLPTTVSSAALRLLVAVCGVLNSDEHQKLAPVLWSNYLDSEDPNVVEPACFLFMHCLEKSAREVSPFIDDERQTADSITKQNIIRRLMTLFSWRFQILTQTYIFDKAKRRPFKLARYPLAFVAIDAGSSTYVHEQTEEDRRNLPGGSLPFELRRRLAEFGWEQDDQPIDTRMEKIRAPMSLFSPLQLDQANGSRDLGAASTSKGTDKLLRRKSSGASSHHGGGSKRRPVFVPALVTLFSSMASMTTDPDTFVAAAAREALLVMLRDDPAMICRPIMDILSSDLRRIGEAVTLLRAFLHVHHRLPPSASHHIFGNLGGFLKHISRDSGDSNVFGAFASTSPILAKLITQVSNLSVRDLRRSKFEIYVFPSGSLWFPPTAPVSPMFPRSLEHGSYHKDEIPEQLANICMIRTAQNMLFLDMLKHKPQEVLIIRKSLIGLVLPGENTGKTLDGNSFLPRRNGEKQRRSGYQQVSLALSRSHLLLLGQVFRSMPRNFNGKAELTSLFDGLNKILLAHGDDIGIVAHALIACMIGVTRFKRFIASNRGFAFFMPALLKAYAEAGGRTSILQAIQYASSRFYAIHEEAYLFQSLDLASNILVRVEKSEDKDWFAQKIWHLFSALKNPINSSTPDAAGIRDCNRAEEREALIATTVTDDIPLSAVQESSQGEQLKKILAIGEYESKLLQLDDLVKLFLTVIAHDTTIIRSQNFLGLFRRMVPNFYQGSMSARDVLREGIGAIGPALFPKTSRQKGPESTQGRPVQSTGTDRPKIEAKNQIEHFEDESSPCDPLIMRREYLGTIVSFIQMGGGLRQSTIRRALDTVKGLLKESARPEPDVERAFLDEFTKAAFIPLVASPKYALSLLQEIAPVILAFAMTTDCSGVLDTITNLLKRTELCRDDAFVRFVVEEVASPLLGICEYAASENMLISLPIRRSLLSLISHAATLGNANVAGIIDKVAPSPAFLSGIVLPLCMMIKTSEEIAIENHMQSKAQTATQGLVFLRILGYVMDVCRLKTDSDGGRVSPSPGLTRRESERSKTSTAKRTPLATMSIAIQIIKVVVFRAAGDISVGLVGIWSRLAQFLKQLLADGNAQFALPFIASPSPSPWQSPTLGPTSVHPSERQSLSSDGHSRPQSGSPRVVDYLTWSLLEFLCCAPSPLNLQMRLWMQEKMYNLDAELKAREIRSSSIARGSRRLSSSVFVKSRGSSVSPDALRASNAFFKIPSELNLSGSSSSDHNHPRFPPSPLSLQPSRPGPRIIHLGPTKDHHAFNEQLECSSFMDSQLKILARKTCITLPILAHMTEDRIRVVQICMGYDRLLPSEGQVNDPADINLKAWTKASTLIMLAEETKLLMDEFPENFHEIVGGGFVDVPANFGLGDALSNSLMKKPVLF